MSSEKKVSSSMNVDSVSIRQRFLDYFKKHNHTVVPSSSLIPAEDPTLLFANAGMNQFKDLFLGREERSYTRATSSQKCVRAGGKHNDLDEVGFTNRHLTFFEMLGNFSFGDYFKKEAIEYAWEFLTKEIGLDENNLVVSVYKTDDESYDIWHKDLKIPKDKIYRLGEADNFWQMGDTGPCGPCTEIHVDRGPDVGCKTKKCDPSCECERFVEVWNLVFMQYDKQDDGTLQSLKKTGVDTGMGLERLCMIVQGKDSIFHTDLFSFLIEKIESLTKKTYAKSSADTQAAFHVLCDHVRSSCLLIADGCSPSNEGRGYVLRKIIRRGCLFGKKLTDRDDLLQKLSTTFIDTMAPFFENLKTNKKLVLNVLNSEIEKFSTNLEQGQQIFEKYFLKQKPKKMVPGEEVFKLYDTYGFPPELTRVMALGKGLTIDMAGFEKEMEKQRAQSGKKVSGKKTSIKIPENIDAGLSLFTKFVGYDSLETKTKISFVENEEDGIWIVVEESPFYVESGGQTSDAGFVTINEKTYPVEKIEILGSGENPAVGIKLHISDGDKKINVGDVAHCVVDYYKRLNAEKNHTATHLLQAALTKVLGEHVKQAGSLVRDDYLRFDFTHQEAMSKDQIEQVEQIVNQKIQDDLEVKTFYTTLKEAQSKGVKAFFGEKYDPEKVRVVQVDTFSAELCGGTHADRTGKIGCFKITGEMALATGTRRITAVTGPAAIRLFQDNFGTIKALSEKYKVKPTEVYRAVIKESENYQKVLKDIKSLRKKLIKVSVPQWVNEFEETGKVPFLFLHFSEQYSSDELRFICQEVEKIKPGFYFLISKSDVGGNTSSKSYRFVGYLSKKCEDIDLKNVAKVLKDSCGLSGGGSSAFIQGGGTSVDKKKIKNCLKEFLV